eukprot:scaffold45844_cov49-Attheya_sp.AAC.6
MYRAGTAEEETEEGTIIINIMPLLLHPCCLSTSMRTLSHIFLSHLAAHAEGRAIPSLFPVRVDWDAPRRYRDLRTTCSSRLTATRPASLEDTVAYVCSTPSRRSGGGEVDGTPRQGNIPVATDKAPRISRLATSVPSAVEAKNDP